MSGVSWSKINQLRAIFQQREFQADLSKIAVATSKVKQTLIAACLEILNHQRELPPDGADLMRSIAILLDCPIPSRLSQASAQRVRG